LQEVEGSADLVPGQISAFLQDIQGGEIINLQSEEELSDLLFGLERPVDKHQTWITEHIIPLCLMIMWL
jgi:hypothetical protein